VEEAIAMIRGHLDQPVELLMERNGEKIVVVATPLSSRPPEQGALGVALTYPTRPATFIESVGAGASITAIQAAAIVYFPIAVLQGLVSPQDARLIGFKGIYDLFDVAVEEDVTSRQDAGNAERAGAAPRPTNWTLNIIGLLSVSLGVFNLFPIPALDGGRILFTLPEILFRKRIPHEWENMVNGIAMLLLISLMLFVNVRDFVDPAQVPIP
jgi:regulator of sigma E protease